MVYLGRKGENYGKNKKRKSKKHLKRYSVCRFYDNNKPIIACGNLYRPS